MDLLAARFILLAAIAGLIAASLWLERHARD